MTESSKQPLYKTIAQDLKRRIDEGEFDKEGRLPAIRDLASDYSTTAVTMTNAIRELDEEGLLKKVLGSGIYLKKRDVDPFFPVGDLKKIFISVLENEGAKAFQYGDSSGFSGLKDVIRERMSKKIKNMEELEILITSGSQQALHLIFSTMLKVGDWVLVEEPTYPAVIRILKEKGVQIETVKMTETGPDLKELKRIFGSRPLKMAYLMPRYHSPTGFCYDEKTKKTVAELSKAHSVYIVEDNSYGELDFGGKIESPLSVDSRFHIYLSSFSKTFLSGARIGCCVCAKDVYSDLTNAKIDTDLASPLFFQIVLAKYIKSGKYDLHLKEMNRFSKVKFDEIRKDMKIS
jgi:DNA-binding transcriptional MocR family regulator